jgi:adhesin/invasin
MLGILATAPANYTFTAADAGVHTFSVTLITPPSQTVTVTDTVNGTLTATSTIAVT